MNRALQNTYTFFNWSKIFKKLDSLPVSTGSNGFSFPALLQRQNDKYLSTKISTLYLEFSKKAVLCLMYTMWLPICLCFSFFSSSLIYNSFANHDATYLFFTVPCGIVKEFKWNISKKIYPWPIVIIIVQGIILFKWYFNV